MGQTLQQSIAAGRRVWIDAHRYAEALFGTLVPWLDQVGFSAFHAKAQGLLRSDVIALPVEEVAAALLAGNERLRAEMAGKSRSVYPLRRLLEDMRLRDTVANLLVVLRASHGEAPLVLAIPSPRRWLALAYEAARGTPLAVDIAGNFDEIDGASVYIADFLRSFADSGIDTLLLCETPGEAPADIEQFSAYQSVINAARRHRWEIGLIDADAQSAPVKGDSFDFVVAPVTDGTGMAGRLLGAEYFDGAAPSPIAAEQFHYAVVPQQAKPERVLERLAALRAA